MAVIAKSMNVSLADGGRISTAGEIVHRYFLILNDSHKTDNNIKRKLTKDALNHNAVFCLWLMVS